MVGVLLGLIAGLLGVICILAFGILFNVSQVKTGISSLIQTTAVLHDISADQSQRFQSTTAHLEQLVEASVNIDRSIADIKDVTDVIYRYKLPNAAERAFLDQMEIDNEVSNGILNSDGRQT